MSRSTLSDFQRLGKIGSGSFGTVYLALRHRDNQNYVLKNISIGELSHKEQLEAINEVKLLASITSVYVVKYFDSFVEEDTLHIVMEYCDKGDLKGLLKREKKKDRIALENDKTWSLFVQIALGLYDIHKQKVLHRDMKTANVFLQSNPDVDKTGGPRYLVKIGDLGVAKLLGTSTAFANTVVGTPYYLSPELCEDKPYNAKSDVWALGIILYECLTLAHPFEARNQCALILKIIKGRYTPVPDANPADAELRELCYKLLTHDCENRPNIPQILNMPNVKAKLLSSGLQLPEELAESPGVEELRQEREEAEEEVPPPMSPKTPPPVKAASSTPPRPAFRPKSSTPKREKPSTPASLSRNPSVPKIHSGPTPAVPSKAANRRPSPTTPSFTITGVNSAPNGSAPSPALSKMPSVKKEGIRGNRVRGGGGKVTSSVAVRKHQIRGGGPVGVVRAVELGVVGMKSKGEFKECKTHEAAADEATADEEEDGEAAASEEEKDDKEIAGEGDGADSESEELMAVMWEVNNVANVAGAPAQIPHTPPLATTSSSRQHVVYDDDIFNTDGEDYHVSPPPDIGVDEDGGLRYEVMEPPDAHLDISNRSDTDSDLDRTREDDEFPSSIQESQPTPRGVEGARRHRDELEKLVRRATKQCRKMLGTSFDEIHELFKERFIREDGRMKGDSEVNEEKEMEMHDAVGNMQDEIVDKCGGLIEACQAVFNVQRLMALEAGLAEAERNLEKGEEGERGEEGGDFDVRQSWETEGAEEEERKYLEDESFEDYDDEAKMAS